MKTINLLLVVLLLVAGINSPIFAEISNVNIYNKRIPTKSAEIDASLYLTVYEPADSAKHPAIVMCPGSWEYGDAWNLYFPPFTPEFIASQGFVAVVWDPRGSFMVNPSGGPLMSLDPKDYGIGRSDPSVPPSIIMLNKTLINDLYDVITFANNMDNVIENKITLMGFSHGATYPIIEKAVKKDKRVSTIISIEPIGDESSMVDLLIGNVPIIGDALVNLSSSIPENVYDILWELLKNSPLQIMGLATKYINDIDCPLVVVQSEQYHAAVSAAIFGGQATSPGVSLYNAATNVPYKLLNRNSENAAADELIDFFPSPIWNDGELFCDYFVDYVKPVILQYSGNY